MIGGAVTGAGWKGLVGVGQGFSVNAAKLQEGSQEVGNLQGRCEVIAGDAVDALAGMAGFGPHRSCWTRIGNVLGRRHGIPARQQWIECLG
jgi:hypothetical protein